MSEDVLVESNSQVDPGDKVAASMSYKKNLGNYQSLDVYASASLTVRPDETDEDAFRRAWSIVEKQLEDKLEEVDYELTKKKK